MHYFKDKQDQIISIEDKYWDRVQKLEPWIKETDKNGRELGTNLTSLKGKTPLEDKVILAPPAAPVTQIKSVDVTEQVIKKVTEPVKTVQVNPVAKLKEEKLTPKRNAKGTRAKRKAKAPKA